MKNKIKKVGFDIVRGCQLRCVGCPNSILKPKIKMISVDLFKKCTNNIDADIEIFRLFNFGEALLHPNIVDILMILRGEYSNIRNIEISTNGQYFNEDILRSIFKNNLIDNFFVSCDGNGTKEEYEQLRPPAKWDKLLFLLESVFYYKNQYSSKVKLGARIIGKGYKSESRWKGVLDPLGFQPIFREWIFLPNTKNDFIKREFSMPNRLCSIFNGFINGKSLYVNIDGAVVPCCAHPGAFFLGDLSKEKYTDIFANKKTVEMKNNLENNRKNIPICKECGM